jgi:protein-S-isoprenylcysteine O-methyltransferase Ste14
LNTLFIAFRAALYAVGFVLLWIWVAGAVRPYDSRLGIETPARLAPVGYPLLALGALLVLACLSLFVLRGRGTPAPFDPPRTFVAAGPYRYVRNPMYLGAWLLLAGFGLVRRSPSILLLSLALLLAAHLFVVLVEEPGLARRFGESYEAYRRTTNRWIPRRPERKS